MASNCVICGRFFRKKPSTKKTCSAICGSQLSKKTCTKYKIKNGLTKHDAHNIKKCIICNKKFIPRNSRNTTCGAIKCKVEHRRKYIEKYYDISTIHKTCIVCNKKFVTKNYRKKCCGDECSKKLRITYKREWRSNNIDGRNRERARQREYAEKHKNDLSVIERRKKQNEIRRNDPEYRKKRLGWWIKRQKCQDFIDRRKERRLKPENRNRELEYLRNRNKDPLFKQRQLEYSRKRRMLPEVKNLKRIQDNKYRNKKRETESLAVTMVALTQPITNKE